MVRTRETDTEDQMLQLEAYRRKMLIYPVEDVLVVLQRWPDEHEFWPTWHELKRELDERMQYRAAVDAPRLTGPARPMSDGDRWAAQRAERWQRMTVEQRRAEIEGHIASLRQNPGLLGDRLIKLGERILANLGKGA